MLDDEQAALIENMNAAVRAHEHAAALLADGVAEGVVRAEYCGVPCQARLDWLNPERGIVDLKTCDNLDWLQTGRPQLRVRPPAGVLPRSPGLRHRIEPPRLPDRRGEARAVPLRRVADGRGRARDRAEGERGGDRAPEDLPRRDTGHGYEDIVFDWI